MSDATDLVPFEPFWQEEEELADPVDEAIAFQDALESALFGREVWTLLLGHSLDPWDEIVGEIPGCGLFASRQEAEAAARSLPFGASCWLAVRIDRPQAVRDRGRVGLLHQVSDSADEDLAELD